MKAIINLLRQGDGKSHFFKKCPNGGYCFNPICMFGCVDSHKSNNYEKL